MTKRTGLYSLALSPLHFSSRCSCRGASSRLVSFSLHTQSVHLQKHIPLPAAQEVFFPHTITIIYHIGCSNVRGQNNKRSTWHNVAHLFFSAHFRQQVLVLGNNLTRDPCAHILQTVLVYRVPKLPVAWTPRALTVILQECSSLSRVASA